eukprot:Tamp_07064.p8 GENE.Tamp_07064~~Tamp_07064.p8  ORF type:complete len:117 (-),score=7.21 Tamp_07064:458-808(-)
MRAVCMCASDLLRACTSYLCAIAPQRLQHRGSKTDETRLDFGPVEHTPASNMYDVVSATSAFKTSLGASQNTNRSFGSGQRFQNAADSLIDPNDPGPGHYNHSGAWCLETRLFVSV